MKIRNAILASGLAIAVSFGFSTNSNANTPSIVIAEDGVMGVIDQPAMDNGNLIVRLQTGSVVQLSLVSSTGQTVWSTKTNKEIVAIPVSGYAAGSYTLVAIEKGKSQFFPVQIMSTGQQGLDAQGNTF